MGYCQKLPGVRGSALFTEREKVQNERGKEHTRLDHMPLFLLLEVIKCSPLFSRTDTDCESSSLCICTAYTISLRVSVGCGFSAGFESMTLLQILKPLLVTNPPLLAFI